MIKRPMLLTVLSFILCIMIYRFFGFYFFIAGILICFGVLSYLNKSLFNIALFGLLLGSLFISIVVTNGKINISKSIRKQEFTGNFIVISEPEVRKNTLVLAKSYDNRFLKNGMKFYLYFREGDFEVGEKITIKARTVNIEEENSLFNLYYSNNYGRIWIKETVSRNGYNRFYFYIGKIRSFVKNHFLSRLSYNSFATLTAIMLGDKNSLSDTFYANVKNSGVSHIMAVSGLHLSVIMGFFFLLLERLVKNRIVCFVVTFAILFFICAICDFKSSIIRAAVMMLFFMVPQLFGRDSDKISTLCLSVVVILLAQPLLIFNISFQMSVSAVFAVMITAPVYGDEIRKHFPINNPLLSGIFDIVLISVFAQIFTAAFSIYMFGMISVAAPITNIFISFAVTVILQLGIISVIICFFPVISGYLLFVADFFIGYINFVITKIGELKYSAFSVPRTVCIIPAVITVLLVFGVYFLNRRKSNAIQCNA